MLYLYVEEAPKCTCKLRDYFKQRKATKKLQKALKEVEISYDPWCGYNTTYTFEYSL